MWRKLLHLISVVLLLCLATSPANGDITAGLVAHWQFEGNFNDSAGTNHATPQGDTEVVTDAERGQVAEFDGTGDYLEIPSSPSLDITGNEITLAAWIYFDDVSGPPEIIIAKVYQETTHASPYFSYGLHILSNGQPRFWLRLGSASRYVPGTVGMIESQRWYHVAGVYNGSQMMLYVDGEVVATGNYTGNITGYDTVLRLGTNGGLTEQMDGKLDDVRIYNRALSDREILSLATGVSLNTAWNPNPANGAAGITTALLQWAAGDTATWHDLYLGTNPTPGPDEFIERVQDNMYWHTPGFTPRTIYYWRIDEVEADGTTIHTGDVWSFQTASLSAQDPSPADGATYVTTDAVLSWEAGAGAIMHDVYLGTDEAQVADGAGDTFKTTVTDTSYQPEPLAKDTTYYWRIDEFDGTTKHKGEVWSLSTAPDIPISDPDLVAWWKLDEGSGTTVLDWSGHDHHGTLKGTTNRVQWAGEGSPVNGDALSFDGYSDGVSHTTDPGTINWVSVEPFDVVGPGITLAAWIRPEGFDIGDARIITKQKTWSSSDIWWMLSTYTDGTALRMRLKTDDGGADNGTTTMFSDTGYLEVGVWSHAAATYDGSKMRLYHNGVEIMSTDKTGTIQTDPTAAVAIGNGPLGDPGGLRATFHGLIDDVRVYSRAYTAAELQNIMIGDPTLASNPTPADGSTTDVEKATSLSWTPGEKAAEHDVYLGTGQTAVENADASDTSGIYRGRRTATSYTPSEGIEFGQTYYWRIDEFNTDGSISKGRIWSFTVAEYLIVDDFEPYDDYCDRIFYTWTDGWGHSGNPDCGVAPSAGNGTGSTVGYLAAPYAEQTIIHDGEQSMPFEYDNTTTPFYSETQREWTTVQDWTRHGVRALTLYFRGLSGSVGSFHSDPGTGIYAMTADGSDIWDTSDQFHFAYRRLSGAGSIQAQVLSVSNTHSWAKAGVMIRDTLDPNSAHAMALITPGQGVVLGYRSAAGDISHNAGQQTGITAPHWVKLERGIGGTLTGYHSTDGSTWETLGSGTIPMAGDVYIGLALTSHNTNATCVAEFSDVSTTGTVTGQWQSQDIGILSNVADQLYVAVEDDAGQSSVVNHEDPNAVQQNTWQAWDVDLKDFSGVNLARVKRMYLGVGNRTSPQAGGTGTLYFDDIRLYQPRCMPELVKPAADLSNDCVVDYADLEILADAWLSTGHLVAPQQPSEAGLVAYWPLQDTLSDITGNGHDGTAVNGASVVGGALVLDGNQQYVEVAHDPALNLTDAFTIASFVQLDVTGDRRPIITKEQMPDASRGWNCWIQDGEPRMQLMDGVKWADTGDVSQSKLTVTSGATLEAGTRYHLAFVYDSTGPEQIYVNGVLQVSEDVVTGTLHVNEQPVRIGAYIWDLAGYHRYLDGSIEDLRMYSRVLSGAEVASLAGGLEPISEPVDLNVDGVVDFKDFAVLADAWLDELLWP